MPLLLSSLGSASDESRLQRPKAEGFRLANSQEKAAVTDRRQRLELFKQLPKDQEEKMCLVQTEAAGVKDLKGQKRRLKSTIRTKPSALSFCCTNKRQHTLV